MAKESSENVGQASITALVDHENNIVGDVVAGKVFHARDSCIRGLQAQ